MIYAIDQKLNNYLLKLTRGKYPMKKITPKFINQSTALVVVVIFVVWTAKGGFKRQVASVYKNGVNNSSDFDDKVNHFADILYQYASYIAFTTMLFYLIRLSQSILSYRSKISSILSLVIFIIIQRVYGLYSKIKKNATPFNELLTKQALQQKINRINIIAIAGYLALIGAIAFQAYNDYKTSKKLISTIVQALFSLLIVYIVSPFIEKSSHFTKSSQKITLYFDQIQQLVIFGGIYIYLLNQSSTKIKDYQSILFPSWIILTFWLRFFSEVSKRREHLSFFLDNLSFYLKILTFGIMILQNSGENIFRYI